MERSTHIFAELLIHRFMGMNNSSRTLVKGLNVDEGNNLFVIAMGHPSIPSVRGLTAYICIRTISDMTGTVTLMFDCRPDLQEVFVITDTSGEVDARTIISHYVKSITEYWGS